MPLDEIIARLGPEERRVIELIARRLLHGAEQYGKLELVTDRRDWVREALEECADGTVYLTLALMNLMVRRPS